MSETGVLIQDIGWQEEQAHDMRCVNRSAGVTVAGTMLIADMIQSDAGTTNVLFGDLASIWVNFIGMPVVANGWRDFAPAVCPNLAGVAVGQVFTGRIHGVVTGAQVINTPAAGLTNALGAKSGAGLRVPADGADQVAGRFDTLVTGASNARQFGCTLSTHTAAATVESLTIMFRGEPLRR